jgi:hypothetical protein
VDAIASSCLVLSCLVAFQILLTGCLYPRFALFWFHVCLVTLLRLAQTFSRALPE